MSGSKYFDRIAIIITALMLVLTVLFMNGAALGIEVTAHTIGYGDRLFDNTKVHTVDIVMDDWDEFIASAASEEYDTANVVIDGESYKNVGIRAKGNTSLSTVASLDSERYSFKIEFDYYDSTKSYHGLDKLSLNNLIQDSTMMKDYLTYTMMNEFGVSSSLCSYVYITVNGEDIESVADTDQVIRYFVVHNFVCNDDSYTGMMVHNYYLYEKDGQLAMIQWDYNLGFGTFGGGDATSIVNTPIDSPVSGASSDRPMLDWIFESEEYTALYHQYFEELLNQVDIQSMIDSTCHLIRDYVEKDPTAFYTCEEFETGVETLRQFCSLRSESISQQLENGETVENMNYADASAITLSDMGSMGGEMGGEMGGFGGGTPNSTDDFEKNFPGQPSGGPSFDRGNMATPSDLGGWIWILISTVILAAGLIVAKKYKG